jgi:DNA repair protein RadC
MSPRHPSSPSAQPTKRARRRPVLEPDSASLPYPTSSGGDAAEGSSLHLPDDPIDLLALVLALDDASSVRSGSSAPRILQVGEPDAPATSRTLLTRILLDEGGLAALSRRTLGSLLQAGLPVSVAHRLRALFALSGQLAAIPREAPAVLSCAEAIAAHLRPRLGHLTHEEMWLVALDGRNHARAVRRIAMGGLHGCAIATRDVLRAALVEAASSFVLVHNHPSGDPSPSEQDVRMTALVYDAAQLVGVPLVDHVIVTHDAHCSIFDAALPLSMLDASRAQ